VVVAELARYPLLEELELLPLKAAEGAHSVCEKSSRLLKKARRLIVSWIETARTLARSLTQP
jgi:hypothetical protein